MYQKTMMSIALLAASSLGLAATIDITGMNATQAGQHIADQAEADGRGYGNVAAKMTMTIIGKTGKKSVRTLHSKSLEVAGEGDKSLAIFEDPRDVKGTALLTYGHKAKADEQWLYLPGLKRVKRISSNNQSGAFMGSEFAFEDLSSQDNSKFNFKLLGEEQYAGVETYKIERTPKNSDSGYSKQISWVEKQPLRMLKVDYFDRKGALLKTLTFSDYVQHKDQYWRANTMLMQNVQTGKSTRIQLSDVTFNDPKVKASDFSVNALKRQR